MKKKNNKILLTDAVRTIELSMSRFISIIAIVALGVSFFAGMNAIAPDMYDTLDEYMQSSNAMDLQIISTAGMTDSDLEVIRSITGVKAVEGVKFVDGIAKVDGEPVNDIDGSEMTVRALPIDMDKLAVVTNGGTDDTFMNRPELIEGSWPTSANQCLVDQSVLSTPSEFQIGKTITIEGTSTDLSESLANRQFTIVGIIRTPLYISYERGNTNVGTGKLGTFFYIPAENFLADYYSSVSVRLVGSENYDPQSKEYEAFVQQYVDYIQSIAPEYLSSRVTELKEKYTAEIAEGELEYAKAKAEVEQQLADGKAQVEQILDLAENGQQQLIEYKQQYNEKATEAANAIDSGKYEHSTQYAKWEEKRAEWNEAKETLAKYENAEQEYNNATTEYNVAKLQVDTMLTTVSYLEDLVATTRSAMDQFNATQDGGIQGMIDRFTQSGIAGEEVNQIISAINSMTAVGTAEEMMAYMEPQLQTFEARLTASKQELLAAKTTLAEKEVQLQQAEELIAKLKVAQEELDAAKIELDEAQAELTAAGYDIQFGELEVLSQLSDMKNQITAFETNLVLAQEKAKTIEADYEQAKLEATEKLEKARLQLDEAKAFLLNLDNAKWAVSPREDCLLGFEQYCQSAKRTAALSTIFPWFFFIVATMVCLNTMTRFIEEERTRLGTFKALGFTDSEIMFKYLIYSLSASVIGSVSGSFLGFAFFPTAMSTAFKMLFDMPNFVIKYRFAYAIPGILISIGCTVAATYFLCHKNLKVVPSTLMRPKAPKGGKKIALEKIPALWSRLSFVWKVTLRNVFRNATRFIMATAAVAGCTGMVLAGLGISDSIDFTLDRQFFAEDRIWNYDLQVVLNGDFDTEYEECSAIDTVKGNSFIKNATLSYMKIYNSVDTDSGEKFETYILVPESGAELNQYINLRERKGDTTHFLGSEGAIITEKLADELDVKPGETMRLEVSDGEYVIIPVAAVVENYAFHYVYMSKELYKSVFGTNPRYNYITANLAVDNMTVEQKDALAKEFMAEYEISAVAYSSQIQNSFENIVDSIRFVVIILIVAAAVLAFVVLYNLSVINITERLKEIATIKVLGFDNMEVSAYIFRENLILTVIGILEGMIVGPLLHYVVLYVAEVDIIMFGRQIDFTSYLMAAALSAMFSLSVNFVLHKKLKSVDMVESLKSIE